MSETIRVCRILPNDPCPVTVRVPRFAAGDRVVTVDDRHGPGGQSGVVERVEGPSLHHTADRSDAWMYYVREDGTGNVCPAKGKRLRHAD